MACSNYCSQNDFQNVVARTLDRRNEDWNQYWASVAANSEADRQRAREQQMEAPQYQSIQEAVTTVHQTLHDLPSMGSPMVTGLLGLAVVGHAATTAAGGIFDAVADVITGTMGKSTR